MALILLVASIAPVIFFGYLIYKRDFDKEPTGILVKLFVCGILSTLLTLLLTYILYAIFPFFNMETEDLNVFTLIPYVFIGVALIEEFSKWIFVYKLEYNDQEFNHLYDGIVYAAFVALGFACFENVLYVMQSGLGTAIMRAFLAIPGHLCDGIMMGYYLSLAKLAKINGNDKLSKKNLILSLVVPVIAHGIYDYLIFASSVSGAALGSIFMVVFFVFVVLFFIYASKKVKQLSSNYYNLNPGYVRPAKQQPVYPQQTGYGYNNYYQGQPNYQQPTYYPNQGYQQQPVYYNNTQPTYPQQTNYNTTYNQGYAQPTTNQTTQPVNNAQPTHKFCSNCGQPINGKYCGHCGQEN